MNSRRTIGSRSGNHHPELILTFGMQMSLKTKKYMKTAAFVLTAALLLQFVSAVCIDKQSQERMGYFYRYPEDSYDVMYFGPSHMLFGIYPMRIWEQYGITGYNCAGYDASMPICYWMFRQMIKTHRPKVAVLDVLNSERVDKWWDVQVTHITWDRIPFSRTKVWAVRDLFSDIAMQREYLFPFYLYHNRWKELTAQDVIRVFRPVENVDMGAVADGRVAPPDYEEDADVPQYQGTGSEDTVNIEYIRRFIHDCRENDIQPVLVFLPYMGVKENLEGANEIYRVAEEEGVPYLNMVYEDGLVDYDSDFSEATVHLNVAGATKVSDYLGQYLADTFALEDHRGDPAYQQWEEYDRRYRSAFNERAADAGTLVQCVNFLFGSANTAELEIRKGAVPEQPEQKLLKEAEEAGLLRVREVEQFSPDPDCVAETAEGKEAGLPEYHITVRDKDTGQLVAGHYYAE